MSAALYEAGARMSWVAIDACRAMLRQRLIVVVLALALVQVMAGHWLRTIDFGGAPARFVIDFGFGALAFFGAAVAIVGTAQLVFNDRESGAAAMILAKPVSGVEYLAGQWAGVMLVLGGLCFGGAGLVLILAEQATPAIEAWGEAAASGTTAISWSSFVVAAFAQWLKFGVVVSGTLLVASYARSSLFTILLAGTLLVVAYLRSMAQSSYDAGGVVATTLKLALELLPDLPLFEVADRITAGVGGAVDSRQLLALVAYALLYVAGYLVLAAWLSRRRDT